MGCLFSLLFISLPLVVPGLPFVGEWADHQDARSQYGIFCPCVRRDLDIQLFSEYRDGSFLLRPGPGYRRGATSMDGSRMIAQAARLCHLAGILRSSQPGCGEWEERRDHGVPLCKTGHPGTVWSPFVQDPWGDAADEEVLQGKLPLYDWLHLHHEDFTGQYGRFWSAYRNAPWYQEDVRIQESMAAKLGYQKVSQMKLAVALRIRDFVVGGGYLFAMCSATDSYDIALSAEGVDICESMFDGDPADPKMNSKLNYESTFAFRNYKLSTNPSEYEFSDIDNQPPQRRIGRTEDMFTLFDFSAKWDPVPTMLCQNHEQVIKGFMGQTTAFKEKFIKPGVLIMGETKSENEARYIHGEYGKGTWTFYSGHDPEDYQHQVGDPVTDLALHPNSPGYRLILNNVLFPAAKKKKQKT
ncbi:MAG: asparagine synthetase B [Bacteroidia bacterium]